MIREVKPEEVETLLQLAKKDGVTFSTGVIFAYTESGIIKGIASICYSTTPKIKTQYTLPDYRGKGVGMKLLRYLIFRLKEQGYKTVKANCKPMSVNLHLALGGIAEKKYDNGITLIKHNLQ